MKGAVLAVSAPKEPCPSCGVPMRIKQVHPIVGMTWACEERGCPG